MIKKNYRDNSNTCRTTFRFVPEEGSENINKVELRGDFNNWAGAEMQKRKNGSFSTTVSLEVGKSYQFRYLINGNQWTNDSEADSYIYGPFGGQNAVVDI